MNVSKLILLCVVVSVVGLTSTLEVRASVSDPIIADLQAKLLIAGFSPGPADGYWGGKTEAALKAFQEAGGLPSSGRLDAETAARLEIDIPGTEGTPQDIHDLIDAGKVEVKASARAMDLVGIELRSGRPYSISVRIPLGTYFTAGSPDLQNMLTTKEVIRSLNSEDWVSISIQAASTDRQRGIPGGDVRLKVQKLPGTSELPKLFPVFSSSGASYPVLQAAIWIVTDNSTFEELAVLIQSQDGFSATRSINEPEVARAMRICSEAGIDIKARKIWSDRATIRGELADETLKEWLEQDP
ncbi:peptidoglycan-binding domain-containing protein [Thiocapsa marina]|uniref:Peptidoglycan-binding domain 1 protein n=1 Tax=Thiocapsa marina 5811 TaxID=768671 RepID=F9UHW5_9GAMM|nr:peptidoglycan-binding domain-containing protein [Thiocapsa marina]EGV16141.1 Peptidoglycan-binding domain 1 protein [Thiocapsa marina 5811]